MEKEAYYFSHDSNTRGDQKIVALMMKHGWAGYGLFWGIIELLRDSTGYSLLPDYNVIAYSLRADTSIVKSIINDFGLFAFADDGECFYSERLLRTMQHKEDKSSKAKRAAALRWESERNANAMQTHSDRNARKGKENKENSIGATFDFVPPLQMPLNKGPDLADIKMYFKGAGGSDSEADRFFNHYSSLCWMKGVTPIVQWRPLANTWIGNGPLKPNQKGNDEPGEDPVQRRQRLIQRQQEQNQQHRG